MNAVFNKRQKMYQYKTRLYTNYNPRTDTASFVADEDIDHLEPVRSASSNIHREWWENVDWASKNLPAAGAPLGNTFRALREGPAVIYRNNPYLYWINMIPKDLYNINKVNTPNPIINSLNNLPVHISSLHRSFS